MGSPAVGALWLLSPGHIGHSGEMQHGGNFAFFKASTQIMKLLIFVLYSSTQRTFKLSIYFIRLSIFSFKVSLAPNFVLNLNFSNLARLHL